MGNFIMNISAGAPERYNNKNNKWYAYDTSEVGHYYSNHPVLRFKLVIPNVENNLPVKYVQNFKINLKGNFTRWTDATGDKPFLVTLVPISELGTGTSYNTNAGLHPTLDYVFQNGTSFYVNSQGAEITIQKQFSPGEYYLYFVYKPEDYNDRYGWIWKNSAVSCECEQVSYTKCNPVSSFSGPRYLKPSASELFKLEWNGANLGGISNEAKSFYLYYSIDNGTKSKFYEIDINNSSISISLNDLNSTVVDWEALRGKIINFSIRVIGTAGEEWGSSEKTYSARINYKTILNKISVKDIEFSDSSILEEPIEVYDEIRPFFTYSVEGSDHGEYQFQYSYNEEEWLILENQKIDFKEMVNSERGYKRIFFRIYDGCEFSNMIVGGFYIIKKLDTNSLTILISPKFQTLNLTYTEKNFRDLPTHLSIYNETLKKNVVLNEELNYEYDAENLQYQIKASPKLLSLIPGQIIKEDEQEYLISISFKNERGSIQQNNILDAQHSFTVEPLKFSCLDSFYSTLTCRANSSIADIKNLSFISDSETSAFEIVREGALIYTIKVIDEESIKENRNYTFKFTATYDYGVIREATIQSIALPRPKIQNIKPEFNLLNNEIKGFEDYFEEEFLISFINGLSEQAKADFQEVYLCNKNSKERYFLNQEDETSTNDTIVWRVNKKSFRNWLVLSQNFDKKYGGIYKIPISIEYVSNNNSEVSYHSLETEILINFERLPEANLDGILVFPKYNNNVLEYFQEGAGFSVSIKELKIYSHQEISFRFSLSQDGINYSALGGYDFNLPFGGDYSGVIGGVIGDEIMPAVDNLEFDFPYPFKEIQSSKVYLKIGVIVGEEKEENWYIGEYRAISHIAPNFIITGGKIETTEEQKTIKLQISGEQGFSMEEYDLEKVNFQVRNVLEYNDLIVEQSELSFNYPVDLDDTSTVFQVQLTYTTTVTQDSLSITKHSKSNIFYVYDEAPTVAYRKNCLGINTKNPDELKQDGILVITQTTGRDKIYFIGESNESILDLSTGRIYNLIVDCGSW